MNTEPASQVGNTVLSANGISKSFGRRLILDAVSFDVAAGEVVGIVGPNGCGKTTLLKICAGLMTPDSGTVAVRDRIGYCPQEAGLIELLNADEHAVLVGAGRGVDRLEAKETTRSFGRMLDWDAADPTVAQNLSGGTRQKLNVSLAQLGEPPVLLLDEPYQGFDRAAYVNLWRAVERWRDDGKGVVVVTHRDDTAGVIDRFVDLTPDLAEPARSNAEGDRP